MIISHPLPLLLEGGPASALTLVLCFILQVCGDTGVQRGLGLPAWKEGGDRASSDEAAQRDRLELGGGSASDCCWPVPLRCLQASLVPAPPPVSGLPVGTAITLPAGGPTDLAREPWLGWPGTDT